MRAEIESRDVVLVQTGANARHSIDDDPLLYAVLSDNIYRDKIRAVVREIACNAYDAHVAGDHADQPIEIHLPTALEPYFSIRDNGIGMSPDFVLRLYNRYGHSEKRQRDDLIGTLGFGSKVGYAYGPTFTFASRWKGVETTYCSYRDEDGYPATSVMSEVQTNEPNGVEVTIAVPKIEDHPRFASAVADVLMHFPVLPMIVNNPEFWTKIASGHDLPLVMGSNWKLYRCGDTPGQDVSGIVMGNVAYRVDKTSIGSLDWAGQNVYGAAFEIDVPMRTVAFTASREDLQYNTKTLTALNDIAKQIVAELPACAQQALDQIPNQYQAHEFYNALMQHRVASLAGVGAKTRPLMFRGNPLTHGIMRIDIKSFSGVTFREYKSQITRTRRVKLAAQSVYDQFSIVPDGETVVAIGGVRDERARVQACISGPYSSKVIVVSGATPEQVKALRAALDGAPMIDLNDVVPARQSRPHVATIPRQIMRLRPESMFGVHPLGKADWEVLPDLPADGGLYVLRNGFHAAKGTTNELLSKILSAKSLGLIGKEPMVLGLNRHTVESLPPGWTPLDAHLTACLEAIPEDPRLMAAFHIRSIQQCRDVNVRGMNKISHSGLDSAHPVMLFAQTYLSVALHDDAVQKMGNLIDRLGYKPSADGFRPLAKQWADLCARYPLLSPVADIQQNVPLNPVSIAHYVQWRDEVISTQTRKDAA